MPFSNLQELRDALRGYVTDGTFAMPPDALGSTSIAQLVTTYFCPQGGTWTLASATEPTISGDAVVFSGRAASLGGLTPALVDLSFDLADAGQPSLLVTLAPRDPRQPSPVPGWNLGNAFPVWAVLRSPLTAIDLDAPALYYSSIPRAASGSRPALAAGLDVAAGEVRLDGILEPLSYVGLRFVDLVGQVTGTPDAPHLTLSSKPVSPIPFGYLDLPLTFSAVSTDPVPWGKVPDPPPPVSTYLELSSSVHVGPSDAPPIPILVKFNGIAALVTLEAQLAGISHYAVAALAKLARDAPIGSYLDPVLQIGTSVELRALDVTVSTRDVAVAAVSLTVGTAQSLTVVPGYVELPDVEVTFLVDDPGGSDDISALLAGTFVFLEHLPVRVTALYPGMVFTGGLTADEPIPIAEIVRKYAPSVQHFPDIYLNDLYVAADFTSRRYAFQLAVSSDWRIPVGIAQFVMRQASLALAYDASLDSGFSGEIAATAALLDDDGTLIAEFFADWRLPGANFVLRGTFPTIPLSRIATILTGGAVPSSGGLPEITLENSVVEFRMAEGAARLARLTGTTSYRFTLTTTVDVDKVGQADLMFEVRRGTAATGDPAAADGTGFVAGLVLRPDWTPDAVWSELGDVFSLMTVRDAGLILSSIEDDRFSLPNLQMHYVPKSVKPGVTFFASMALTGDTFDLLTQLFGAPVELDLYAYIDPSNLTRSEIAASLPATAPGKGAITFDGLTIDMKPGAGEFSITAGARFDVHGETLHLTGSGDLRLSGPSATFTIAVTDWVEPFGIKNLKILAFGLDFSVAPADVGISILGSFHVGAPPDDFTFTVGGRIDDFAEPGGFVFALAAHDRPLHVTDLVAQFTSLDLGSVPLLDGLAFRTLAFYVVAAPGGWLAPDGHFYPQGIGVDADILFYDWELKLTMVVAYASGIKADGSISKPIAVGDLLVLSDATGATGPSAHIDTTGVSPRPASVADRLDEQLLRRLWPLPPGTSWAATGINPFEVLTAGDPAKTYFAMSGGVRVLGLHATFSGSVTSGGFEVNFFADLADLFRAQFMASYSSSAGFAGDFDGSFDFRLEFPDGVVVDGYRVLPAGIVVEGPNARLTASCAVDKSDAYVAGELDFHWGEIHINPHFRLDAREVADMLANLWQHIQQWMRDNVRAFFGDLLSDADVWVAQLENGFLWAGQSALEIAEALYHVFRVTSIEDLARKLVTIGRLGYSEMVAALQSVFDVDFATAVRALERAGEQCAVASNEAVLWSPYPERLGARRGGIAPAPRAPETRPDERGDRE